MSVEAFCTSCGATLPAAGNCSCGETGSATYNEKFALSEIRQLPKICSCCLVPTEGTVTWAAGRAVGYSPRLGTIHEGVTVPLCPPCNGRFRGLDRLRLFLFVVIPFSVVAYFGSRDPQPPGKVILAWIGAAVVAAVAIGWALKFLPMFKKRGHVHRCIGASASGETMYFHNRAFGKQARAHRVA